MSFFAVLAEIKLHRMKCVVIVFIAGVSLCLTRCTSQRKVVYNIPPTYSKEQKEDFLKKMDKGLVLYKANCADCHGIFTKGKDGIPDFTHEQVDNYSAGYLRADPKNHAVAINMGPDQFLSIMSFLSSRKVDTTLRKVYQPAKPVIDFK